MVDVSDRVLDLLDEAEGLAHGTNCLPERALALCSKASYLAPGDPEVLECRADVHLGLGDLSSAVVLLRNAFKLAPDDSARRKRLATVLDAHGCVLLEEGALKRAKACFDEALTLELRDATFWTHRALAHLQMAKVHSALADLNKAIEFDPSNGELFILRAKLFWNMQFQDRAMKDLKRAKNLCNGLHPEISRFETTLSATSGTSKDSISQSMMGGDFHNALQLLKQALRTSPGDVQLLLQAATAARHVGDLALAASYSEEAAKHARRRTVLEVKQAKLQQALVYNDTAASSIANDNDPSAALKSLNTAIELHPGSAAMYRNRGDCHRLLNDHTLAEKDYRRAKELDPDDAEVDARLALLSYFRGQAHFNAGKYKEAEARFTEAIRISGEGQSEYFANRGLARICLGNTDDALEDFERALQLDPSNARARSWLAQCRRDSKK